MFHLRTILGSAALATLCVGCSAAATLPGPPDWNRSVTEPTVANATTERASCTFKAGALPAETQGQGYPNGTDIPIDHIVVMMMENRSFDHYFQQLPQNGQTDVEVAPASFHNLDNSGMPVYPTRDTALCFVDTAHGWDEVHLQVNGGKMDGFFSTNDQDHDTSIMGGSMNMISGTRGLTYYEAEDLPLYYWIANNFSIADHYHSALQGPTWPNRMYMYGATSRGKTGNDFVQNDKNLIFDELTERQVPWTIYYNGDPGIGVFPDRFIEFYDNDSPVPEMAPLDQFFTDAAAGKLPSVLFLDPGLGHEGVQSSDEHPPAMMQVGQQLIAKVVSALITSPNWAHTALFMTYDEHGGLYDHVVPPAACPPDEYYPNVDDSEPSPIPSPAPGQGFDALGIRVPMLVISPYAKKHAVAHHTYDHTSILRFIEARFVMPALTNRDANAEAPWEMFDFSKADNLSPGQPPMPTIDQAKLNTCISVFGAGGD